MKKIWTLLLAGALTFSLAACGSTTDQTGANQSQASTEPTLTESLESNVIASEETVAADEETTEPETETATESVETENTQEAEEETAGGQILVAYFSWSGNTEELALMIQEETDGDLFEIVPETPYTDDYSTLLDVAQQEKGDDARPALSSHVENWDDYDTIFVGYPNWWSDAPMVILSFLEEYDCTGKTIVPFCTSGGGGFGGSLSSIEGSAAGATIAEGFHVGGSSVGNAGDNVAAWVEGLALTAE